MDLTRPYLQLLLITAGSALVSPLLHLLLVRGLELFSRPADRQKGPLVSGGIGLILTLSVLLAWSASHGKPGLLPDLPPLVYGLGAYLLFAYFYFHFFNMSETARRIKILVESGRGPGTAGPELARNYTGRGMILIRLERLVALGELRKEEDRYYPGRGILFLPALLVSTLHRLLFPDGGNRPPQSPS